MIKWTRRGNEFASTRGTVARASRGADARQFSVSIPGVIENRFLTTIHAPARVRDARRRLSLRNCDAVYLYLYIYAYRRRCGAGAGVRVAFGTSHARETAPRRAAPPVSIQVRVIPRRKCNYFFSLTSTDLPSPFPCASVCPRVAERERRISAINARRVRN